MNERVKLVLISNREPYIHERTKRGIRCKVPTGGLVTALDPVMRNTHGTWIAWGSGSADMDVTDKNGIIMVPEDDPSYSLRRIWLTTKEVTDYYYGFSNRVLWPVCHLFQENAQFKREYWDAYKKVNNKFSEAALDELKDGGRVWVQDVHFNLVPAAIRDELPNVSIAYFWHIPFPPWEAFSCIPWRKELLMGLLGSDLIGFHTSAYVNNFLRTVKKEIPDVMINDDSIELNERTTKVRSFPIGIDYAKYNELGGRQRIVKSASRLRKKMYLDHIILGVDRLDYTKGILNRLLAFERFLESNPRYIGKVSFIQVASPTRSIIAEYREMKRDIEENVGRINGRFQLPHWTPIIYISRHIPSDELLTLYKLADVGLVTPVIDGMNLVAKEYVSVNEKGVLILSEFAGASEEMKDAIIVNPHDINQTARAIFNALNMTEEERAKQSNALRKVVKDHDIYWWLDTFLNEWNAGSDDIFKGDKKRDHKQPAMISSGR